MRLKYILLLMVFALSSSLYAQKVREVKLKLRNQPEPVSYLVSDIDSITFSKSENLPHGPYSVSVSNVTAVSAVVMSFPTTMPSHTISILCQRPTMRLPAVTCLP